MHLENRLRRKICRTVFIPGEPHLLYCGKLIISKLVKEYSVLSPAIKQRKLAVILSIWQSVALSSA